MKFSKAVVASVGALVISASTQTAAETLQEVISEVISTNPDVLIEVHERLARDDAKRQAEAGYLPTVDVTLGQGYENTQSTSTLQTNGKKVNRELNRTEAQVLARQMLWDGWATRSERKRTHARVEAQAHAINAAAQNVSLRASEVFINVIREETLLKLAEENYGAHETIYDQIKLRSRTGVGSKAAEDQTEGRRALAQSNVIAEENNLRDAMANYIRVIGHLPASDLVEPPKLAHELPSSIAEATQAALDNHPTLKSANADITQAVGQYEAAQSPFYPRFDLEISRSWNNDIDGVNGINEDFLAMVRMRYNVYNGGADLARVHETFDLVNQAKEIRNRTFRQVAESVQLSWNSYKAADAQLGFLSQHMASTTATKEAYTKQFNIGQRTLLDLLDTENELFESQRAYVNARYDRLFAQYRVLAALGKLVTSLGGTLPSEAATPAELQKVDWKSLGR